MAASFRGHLDIVNQLLAEGASVNAARNDDGATALIMAVQRHHLAIVRALTENGRADVNTRDAAGLTALMYASSSGDLAIVKQLLAAGAIVNAQNHDGDTALCFATEISTMLLGVNLRDGRYREAAPGWLCVNQRSAVAAALREAGENQLAAAAAAALPDTPPHYR